MTTRGEIIAALEEQKALVTRLVAATPAEGWLSGAHENGWNARELLSHLASMSRVAGFVVAMANVPPTTIPATFNQDAFNAEQVAIRASKSVREVADEICGNLDSDVTSVRKATDELLAKHYKAPWETEGTVAEVVLASMREHNGKHLGELSAALS